MAGYSHNQERRQAAMGRIGTVIENVDMLANGILAGEIFLREAAVDHHYARGVLVVRIRDEAAAQKRNAHDLQILGLDKVLKRERQVHLVGWRRVSLYPKGSLIVALHELRSLFYGDILRPWNAVHGRTQLPNEGADAIRRLLRQRRRGMDGERDDVMRIKSRIDSPELQQRASHKARADEQHEGHGHLTDDKGRLRARAVPGNRAPTVFQRLADIWRGALQRGRQPEKDSGENRNGESEQEHASIKADFFSARQR